MSTTTPINVTIGFGALTLPLLVAGFFVPYVNWIGLNLLLIVMIISTVIAKKTERQAKSKAVIPAFGTPLISTMICFGSFTLIVYTVGILMYLSGGFPAPVQDISTHFKMILEFTNILSTVSYVGILLASVVTVAIAVIFYVIFLVLSFQIRKTVLQILKRHDVDVVVAFPTIGKSTF